ncbi:PrsW family intramembrane metalloprotease [Patescibacteria group bacterium]|nr:PrsW family intramembrane metalloprotease [Patescibacteria group bacterium]
MNISNLAIAFFFAFIPAMGWLVLYYRKDAKDPEPKKAIAQTFLVGIAMVIPFIFLRYVIIWLNLSPLFLSGLSGTIVFALMEEMAKLSAAIFVVSRHRMEFNQLIDGVVYAVTAALGFAFMENLFYLSSFLSSNLYGENFVYVVAFRNLGTMLAHTLFSGLAGLIWAYAYFSKQITPFSKKHLLTFELKDFINREILSLHIIRQNILKARPSRRGGHEKKVLVLEGIILATFLHIIFNMTTSLELFGKNLTFMAVPGIIGGFLYISYLFTKKLNTKILKVV